MNNLLKFSFFVGVLLIGSVSYGQEMKVSGTIYDSTGARVVPNAMIMAVRMKDSILLGFTRTNSKGEFELKGFEIDTFSLIIDHPGFDEKIYYMFGHSDNFDINIPSVTMPMRAQEIEEVVIYANKNPIFYRGDTLVYVADSFKVHEGAVVEDLLKKLPGIEVDKDGRITFGGEEISQVLVDGDEFFGTDPTIATKNLGADGIDQVQIYEKENDEEIGGDDEMIQVLDLKLKDDAKKGYFGRISGASDFALTSMIDGDNNYDINNSFYEGELLLNKFNGNQKISVFALSSNTPRSNFGWGDKNKFGLENENSGASRWGGDNTNNTNGIPQTFKTGFYFSDKIGKKENTKIGFNYSYYNDILDANSASESQYYLTDTTYLSDDSIRNYTANESHRFNLNFESKLDSLTTLTIKPSLSFDYGNSESLAVSEFFDLNGDRTIGTSVDNKDESTGYRIIGSARLNRKFKKKKRELEVRYDVTIIDNNTEGTLNSSTNYLSTSQQDSITDQEKTNNNTTSSHYGRLRYVEPLGEKFKLEFEYLYEYGFSTQDKKTFDNNNGVYNIPRDDLSNVFENVRQQNRVGLRLIFDLKKHTISAGLRIRNIKIDNSNSITGSEINQNINNILPRFRYKFHVGRGLRFNVEYKTSSQQPSINSLQSVQDNSNPNRVVEGNPLLQPDYKHSVNIRYHKFDLMSSRFSWAGGNISYTNNAFTDSTTYDSYGRTQSKTVNVDGNIFGVVYAGISLPFFSRKISIQPNFSGSYFKNTNYISGRENVTDNYSLTPSLELNFNLLGDSMEIELNSSYSYNNAISSLSKIATPYSIQKYGASFVWRLPLGFKFGLDGEYTKNSQPGEGFYDTEYFVFNAEIGKRFLKTQNLEVSIIGNDIFNENINARREVNGNIITDYRTTVISRYFLLKTTFRFNNRKAREDDFTGRH
jgi:hypothetical protein